MVVNGPSNNPETRRIDALFCNYVPFGGLEKTIVDVDAATLRTEHTDDELRQLLERANQDIEECKTKAIDAQQAIASWKRYLVRRSLRIIRLEDLLNDDQLTLDHAHIYQQRLEDFRAKLVQAVALSREEYAGFHAARATERDQRQRGREAFERIRTIAEEENIPLQVAQTLVTHLQDFDREQRARATRALTGTIGVDEYRQPGICEQSLLLQIRTLGEDYPQEQVENWTVRLAQRMFGSKGQLQNEVRLAIHIANEMPPGEDLDE